MKTSNKQIRMLSSLVFTALLISLTSCYKDELDCIRGKGMFTTEVRSVPVFNSVDLRIPAKVNITQDASFRIEVRTYNNLHREIYSYVSGNVLIIDSDVCIRNGGDDIQIYIWAPDFAKLRISGSGTIISTNLLVVPDIDMNITGSGSIDVALNTAIAYSRVNGSGNIMIEGEAYEHNIEISGSGSISSFPFYTERCNVSISGSGNCDVRVFERLLVSISGSGTVRYKGYPNISSTISGSGRVINAN